MQAEPAEMEYPESDGKPMSDNTLQAFWIILIYTNLNALFPDFVAADLLWYPEEGNRKALAPDVMVAIGRPKGHRSSYFPWKEGKIQPQVVFEIRSPSNTNAEMAEKRADYERFGVEEYYHYDPHRNLLEVFIRQHEILQKVSVVGSFDSPRLKIRFLLKPTGMQILDPEGQPFRLLEEERLHRQLAEIQVRTMIEQTQAMAEHAALLAQQMEAERQLKEQERAKAEQERAKAEQERAKAEQEHARAEKEHERAERLAARLRALGLEE